MGLFDNANFDDPKTMGLLAAAAQMFNASAPSTKPTSFGQVLGGGLMGGLNAYQGAQKQQQEYAMKQEQMRQLAEDRIATNGYRNMQMAQIKQKNDAGLAQQAAIERVKAKFAENPNYPLTDADRLEIGGVDAIKSMGGAGDEYGLNATRGINPKTGEEEYFTLSKGGKQNWTGTKVPASVKLIRGSGDTPDMIFDPQKRNMSIAQMATQSSFPSAGGAANLSALPPLPQFGGSANLPLPMPIPAPTAQAAQSTLNAPMQGILRKAPEKQMTQPQEAKYRDGIANDYKTLTDAINTMNEIKTSSSDVLKNEKGISGITGLESYIPSWPNSKAAKADVSLQNLKGKITQLGKVAASAGGAIGAIANQEWQIMSNMIGAIDPAKGDEPLKEQIRKVELYAEGAAKRMADVYDKQYSVDFEKYPQFQTPKFGQDKPVDAPNSQPSQQPAKVRKYNPSTGRIE